MIVGAGAGAGAGIGAGAGDGAGIGVGALAQETGTSNIMTRAIPMSILFIREPPVYYPYLLYYNAGGMKRLGGFITSVLP